MTNKKHKTWDGDGILSVRNGYAVLQDVDGRSLGRTAWNKPLLPESTLSISGKDVEVDQSISKADFLSGKHFLGGKLPEKPTPQAPMQRSQHRIKVNPPPAKNSDADEPIVLTSKPMAKSFKTPLVKRPGTMTPGMQQAKPKPKPLHDPDAPNALAMKRPEEPKNGKQVVDVVVDPLMTRHLRDHQREGVRFLYECVMGLRLETGEGAILADEMGLGKTLQTIALLWTLMKQNPIWGSPPVVRKALIVCPVSLINNWRKEIRKWLGPDRLGVFVVEDKKSRITDFTKGKAYNIMIVGYEKLRMIQADLEKCDLIDIVIIDEGHRLKTAHNKAAAAIKTLSTERRIILTGTPIQNDLSEFYTMVDFVNPGLLSKYSTFKQQFEIPILQSRQPNCTTTNKEKGEARSEELAQLTKQFILRRTSEIIARFLPPKTETIMYCKPTKSQADLYRAIVGLPAFGAGLSGMNESALQLITILKKVCNSPSLLSKSANSDDTAGENTRALLADVDPKLLNMRPGTSTKLLVLDNLLHSLRADTEEKVVIASNSTAMLDVIATLLNTLEYPHVRIDGQTPANKRQPIVDKFNRSPASESFVCLLSTKAGGMGINLIGASRLVLFDSDWNPAHDLQAMARIHRDGQKLPCYIYRFLVQGAIDEKIFQRQLTKSGLADAIVDSKRTAQGFSIDELRDLFRFDENDECGTHSLLGCTCDGEGNSQALDTNQAKEEYGTSMDDPAADDSDDEPILGKLVTADRFEELERQQKKRDAKNDQSKMLALMQYLHIDVRKLRVKKDDDDDDNKELETLVEDQILLNAIKDPDSRVNFIFARTTS